MGSNKRINPNQLPWFPFHAKEWLESDTILSMSNAEVGIYTKLMAHCWMKGSLLWTPKGLSKLLGGLDKRTVMNFMEKYGNLTGEFREDYGKVPGELQESSRKVTLPDMAKFASTLKNYDPQPVQREKESKKEIKTEIIPSSPPRGDKVSPISSPASKAKTKAPTTGGFDPLTYKEPVDSTKGDQLEYDSDDVRRTLRFHFEKNKGEFWSKHITSPEKLAKHISRMYDQMVEEVGEDWNPDAVTKTTGVKKKASAAAPSTPVDNPKNYCPVCKLNWVDCKCD